MTVSKKNLEKRLYLRVVSLIVLAISLFSITSQAESFSIVSNPSPPPQGRVGEYYSVKFRTTLPPGYKLSWQCDPANPVPGLSFSTMSNVEEITLSGTPTQAGTFTFTLRAVYKESATAQFTITIKPYFNIIVQQIEPVDQRAPGLPPRPRNIYEGEYCRFEIYTDHPDGMNARISWTVTGSVPGLVVKPLKGYTLMNSPIIFIEGNASRAGTYWVEVTAEDIGGHRAKERFPVTIHPSYCIPRIGLDRADIEWDITLLVYDIKSAMEIREIIGVRVERSCRGTPKDVRFKLYLTGLPQGLEAIRNVETDPLPVNRTTYDLFRGWKTLTDERPVLDCSFALLIREPFRVADLYPGKRYSVEICAVSEDGYTFKSNFTLRIFYRLYPLTILDLKPVSQLPNPNHIVPYDLVAGKQATFRFDYLLTSDHPINVTLRLTFSKNEWNLGPAQCKDGRRFKIVETPTEFYIEQWFLLSPTSGERTTRIFLEDTIDDRVCFPVPKNIPSVSVRFELVKIGRRAVDELPVYMRFQTSFSFRPWPSIGNIKLGYFLMDDPEGSIATFYFTDPVYFPDDLKQYISGIFPVTVKEVRFIRYVGRTREDGWNSSRLSEEAVEAGVDRAIVIVPHNALEDVAGAGVIGCVFGGSPVAYVDEYSANDEYMPVVAHELSHTFGYPDIYYGIKFPVNFCKTCPHYGYTRNASSREGCSGVPYVLGYWAYFDEVRGGLIRIGEYNRTHDIMACGDDRNHWAYHSWLTVARACSRFEDPPDGLIVSLILFKNGTIIGRPFTRLYNHSRPFLSTNATGNYRLVLFSRDGKILRSYFLNITDESFKIFGTDLETDFTHIIGVVEWFNDLGKIELVGPDGRVRFSRTVSLNEPKVSIEYPFRNMRLKRGKTYHLKWRGNDADGDNLWFNVQIRRSNESSWMIIAHRTTENTVSFTVPESFEEGNYVLMVKATDGVNTGYDTINLQIVETLPVYTLTVSSNIGVQIGGSGAYEEWSNVTLTAPQSVPLEGVLGILGGRYVFQEWTGFTNTRQNPVSIIVYSEEKTLTMKAIYTQDLTITYIVVAAIALLVLASIALIMIRRRRKPLPPPPPSD